MSEEKNADVEVVNGKEVDNNEKQEDVPTEKIEDDPTEAKSGEVQSTPEPGEPFA